MENQEFNPYGGEVAESTGNSGTGEVQGYCLTSYGLNDKGSLELVFTKTFESGKSISLKGWINDVDPEKVTVFEGQTKEKAITNAFNKMKRTVWSVVRQFADEATIGAAQGRVKASFESLVEESKACLPEGFDKVEGRLVVGYKDNGYMAFPTRMQWDNDTKRYLPFFTTDPDQKLCGLGNLTSEKPDVAVESEPTEAVSW